MTKKILDGETDGLCDGTGKISHGMLEGFGVCKGCSACQKQDGETEDDNVVDMRILRFQTFIPSRGSAVVPVMEGLSDLISIMEANLIQEKYGLSVMFDQVNIRWEARDPRGHCIALGNTPAAAIFLWDHEREKAEGKKE